MKSKMLENLEKKFNVASKLAEDLDEIGKEIGISDLEVIDQNLPAEQIESVFTLNQLKADAELVHKNLRSLVLKGQRIMDQLDTLDIADMKASQIEAITCLQNTIANNLKMIIDIYKNIAEIEKMKGTMASKFNQEGVSMVNTGTVVNNQIMFSGSPNDLLNILKPQN
jgi:hypothetical protein